MHYYANYSHTLMLPNGKAVHVPTVETRELGRKLQKWILRRWRPPRYFFHLRHGGHVAAVRLHLHDSWFLRCDLAECFAHVTRTKIHRCLKCIGFTHRDAWEFACKSTVLKSPASKTFSLPFGFPQSTILASLVIDKSALGTVLRDCWHSTVRMSVYVDDIIISSVAGETLEDAMQRISSAAIKFSDFKINTAKTTEGPVRTVDVFNIQLSYESMRITDERIAAFEAAMRRNSLHSNNAIISYAKTVNKEQGMRLEYVKGDSKTR